MNRYTKLTTVVIILFLSLAGCDDQVMNMNPLDQVSDVDVWNDPALAETFLNDMYAGMGHGYEGTSLWAMSDDGHNIRFGDTHQQTQSIISPANLGALGGGRFSRYRWGDLYGRIRQVNIFLSRIDEANIEDEAWRDRMKGEAHFLRAYFYHNLVKIYGGVPLITKVYELNDDYNAARNTFAETIDFIVADADSAAALLPLAHASGDGARATRGAALALKSRMLLYAASDLYHANPSGMPETGYTEARDRQAFWRAAKNAAEDVMNLGVYDLFRADPASGESAAQNYADLFLTPANEEVIMSRFFITTRDDYPNVGRYMGPNGYHNWGSNTPIQQIVDAYRMADGSTFDWNNPEHAAAPYENRDPRFYASIQYDGAKWVERPSDVVELDPQGIIQTFTALTLPNGDVVPGLDTRNGPIEEWNGGYAGYYLRKFVDPSVDHQFEKQDVPWIFFRYAEVLLNYAEASIELGEEADARRVLNEIRRRAGMPALDGTVTGQDLMAEYRNERRVELAFEEHRFFDVRRWMIAPTVLDEDGKGIHIVAEATDRRDRSTYSNYEYSVIDVEERSWNDKMYFSPIPRDEMNRNDQLVQNPGF